MWMKQRLQDGAEMWCSVLCKEINGNNKRFVAPIKTPRPSRLTPTGMIGHNSTVEYARQRLQLNQRSELFEYCQLRLCSFLEESNSIARVRQATLTTWVIFPRHQNLWPSVYMYHVRVKNSCAWKWNNSSITKINKTHFLWV